MVYTVSVITYFENCGEMSNVSDYDNESYHSLTEAMTFMQQKMCKRVKVDAPLEELHHENVEGFCKWLAAQIDETWYPDWYSGDGVQIINDKDRMFIGLPGMCPFGATGTQREAGIAYYQSEKICIVGFYSTEDKGTDVLGVVRRT